MITITISGPQGSGKTQIGNKIESLLNRLYLTGAEKPLTVKRAFEGDTLNLDSTNPQMVLIKETNQ